MSTIYYQIKSELVKSRSLVSTYVLSIIFFVFTIGIPTGTMLGINAMNLSESQIGDTNPNEFLWSISSIGLALSSLLVAVFSILVITGEYSSSTISSTLASAGKRYKVFSAKVIFVTVFSFILTFVSSLVAALIVWSVASESLKGGATNTIGEFLAYGWQSGLLNTTLGTVMFTLIALAIGFIIRNQAGSILIFFVLVNILTSVLSIVNGFMSNDLVKGILKILPSNCYSSFIRATPASDTMLSTSQGGIVLLVWVVATLTAGYVLFNKRDA